MPRSIQSVTGKVGRLSTVLQCSLLLASSVASLSLLLTSSAIAQEELTAEQTPISTRPQSPIRTPIHDNRLADAHTADEGASSSDADLADGESAESVNIESLRVIPQFRVGANTEAGGIPASLTAFDGFFPLLQSPGHRVTFLNTRLNIDFDADNSLGGTVLFGHRSYSSERERILGGYVSLDVRDTGDSVFPQVGFGFERLGDRWDIRANGYVPVGDTLKRVDRDIFTSSASTTDIGDAAFQGNLLSATVTTTLTDTVLQRDRLEAALGGFDVEAGTRLARWNEHGELRFYGGVYYLGGHDVSAVGGRGRIEIAPVESVRLMAGIQGDSVFDVQGFFGASFLFPTPQVLKNDVDPDERAEAIAAVGETVTRLADPVARNFNVIVDEQREVEVSSTVTTISEEVAFINPETGDPWRFTHVALDGSSDGTFEDPFGLLQDGLDATVGDSNDIVFVALADNTEVDPFTIPDNVRVLSTGPEQELDAILPGTSITSVVLPGSDDGNFPDVMGTVTVGSDTKLSGFDIAGVTDAAIFGPGTAMGEIEISDNRLTSPVGDGIEFDDIAGDVTLLIARNTIDGVADSAIDFGNIDSGSVMVTIEDNNLSNAEDDGIDLDVIGGNTILNLIIADNTIEMVDQGIEVDGFSGQSESTVAIENNDISNSDDTGIFIGGIGGDSTVANIQISQNIILASGVDGIAFSNIVESANADVEISGNTISDNVDDGIEFSSILNSSTADIIISNNTISDNSSDGIQFDDIQNSATANVVISNNTISDNADDGIQFDDIQNSAIADIIISNNTISGLAGQGIVLDEIENEASLNLTVSNNVITDVGANGIQLDIIQDTATAVVNISDNEIEETGGDGLDLDIGGMSTVQLTVNNNSIQSTTGGGIDIDNTTLNTTVTAVGNTVGDNGQAGFSLANESNLVAASVCLVLDNNTGTNTSVADFQLVNNAILMAPADFTVVDLTTVTLRNSGSFDPVNIATNPNFTNAPNSCPI